MTFNTLKNDAATDAIMQSYEGVLTNEFTRFEVQLIAKYNGISFDYGITSRDTLISMMKERRLPIPDNETMQTYIKMHREEVRKNAKVKPAKVKKDATVKTKTKTKTSDKDKTDVVAEVDYKAMPRKELVQAGLKKGLKMVVRH